jgi:hypothetical protein
MKEPGVGYLKIEQSESEVLCTDSTVLVTAASNECKKTKRAQEKL